MSDGFAGFSAWRTNQMSPVEQIRYAARVEAEAAKRAAEEQAAAEELEWVDLHEGGEPGAAGE